jgi:glycosyl transferase family 87
VTETKNGPTAHQPSRRARLLIAIVVGVVTAIVSALRIRRIFAFTQIGDLTPIFVGAQAVISGADPYSTVAGRTDLWLHLLFYPLPASLLLTPLAWLPMQLAATLFEAVGAAWLAYASTRDGWWPLWLFASAGFWQSVISVQWSPLLLGAALAGAPAGLAIAAKPTMALPLLAMQTQRRAVIGAIALATAIVLASLVIDPHWPLNYYRTVRESPVHGEYVSPAFTLLGLPLWLALLRWRDWRGRLLLGMAITPLNAYSHSYLALMLVARNRFQMALLGLASWIAFFATVRITFSLVSSSPLTLVTPYIEHIAVLGYCLPALVLVLQHPNEGPAPLWLETRVARWPAWLRGSAVNGDKASPASIADVRV